MERRRRSARALGLSLSLACALASASAHAQKAPSDRERAAAREAATQGSEAFKAGKYVEAIDYFTRAEAIVHAPTHGLMIARAHAAQGKLVLAREAYLKVTREELDAKASEAFKRAKADATRELKDLEPRLAGLVVKVSPDKAEGLEVTLDGQPVPLALVGIRQPADPGQRVVRVTAKGYRAVERKVELKEGGSGEVSLTLERDAAPGPSTPAPVGGPTREPVVAPEGPPARDSAASSPLVPLGVASLAVGVAGLAVGGALVGLSAGKRGEADAKFGECGVGCNGSRAAEVRALDDEATTLGNASIGGFVGGGVLAGVGVVLLVLAPKKKAVARVPGSSLELAPVAGPTYWGLRGSF